MKPTIIRTLLASLMAAIFSLALCGCADTELQKKLAKVNSNIAKVKAEMARLTPDTGASGARTLIGRGGTTDDIQMLTGGGILKLRWPWRMVSPNFSIALRVSSCSLFQSSALRSSSLI